MRILVSILHGLIALIMGAAVLITAVQFRANMAWEQGFYGEVSSETTAGLIVVPIMVALSVVQGVSSIGWLYRRRASGLALLGLSIFYGFITPTPIRWLLIACAFSVGTELWLQSRPPVPVVPAE
ncbi:MAG: hypothetical protein ACJAZO_002307 [Myxococcota bacterium]|jgi:hypothetical protein